MIATRARRRSAHTEGYAWLLGQTEQIYDSGLGSRGTRYVLVDDAGGRWLLDVDALGALTTVQDGAGRVWDIVLRSPSGTFYRVGVAGSSIIDRNGALVTTVVTEEGVPAIRLRAVSSGQNYLLSVDDDGALLTRPLG